jgi:predicted GNAT superfamily acetyltransferase
MGVVIRSLASGDEVSACQELQLRIWAFPDGLEVLPSHVLMTVPKNGGLVLGAFHEGELVGFLFGYPGLEASGKPKHCSHMMGVAPEYRGQGIGHQLKLAQRDHVLAQGLDVVTWTYDPLESRNARLNLHKLGALCRTYMADFYGPMTDGLNRGLPSDRVQVEWWIAGDHVRQRLAGERSRETWASLGQANRTGRNAAGLLTPGPLTESPGSEGPGSEGVLYEIPADFQHIKTSDSGLAVEWRLATREALEIYFSAGYAATDFLSAATKGERRCAYVLQVCSEHPE